MLIQPEVATEADVAHRAKFQATVMSNEVFTVTVVENTLQLAEQFLMTASTEKYRISLTDSRIVVSKDNSYEIICEDFAILNKYVKLDQIAGDNKVGAIIQKITELVKDQRRLRAEFRAENADIEKTQTKTETKPEAAPEHGAKVIEEVYENQRSLVVGDYSSRVLIPYIDKCGPWSDVNGVPRLRDDTLPNENWKWTTEWRPDTERPRVDPEGWEYSLTWSLPWSPVKSSISYVRRRRWVRERIFQDPKKIEAEEEKSEVKPETSEQPAPIADTRLSNRLSFPAVVNTIMRLHRRAQSEHLKIKRSESQASVVAEPTADLSEYTVLPKDKPELISLILEVIVLLLIVVVVAMSISTFVQLRSIETEVASFTNVQQHLLERLQLRLFELSKSN